MKNNNQINWEGIPIAVICLTVLHLMTTSEKIS